jgi:predicted RNase H-like HicB family nuclease
MTLTMRLTVILEEQEEGGYTVIVPSLPGCISQGETKDEALTNIKEAIALYLETEQADLSNYAGEKVDVVI